MIYAKKIKKNLRISKKMLNFATDIKNINLKYVNWV